MNRTQFEEPLAMRNIPSESLADTGRGRMTEKGSQEQFPESPEALLCFHSRPALASKLWLQVVSSASGASFQGASLTWRSRFVPCAPLHSTK